MSRFSRYASGFAIAFGVMVLTGWVLHVQGLKGFIPGQVTVKANTAVSFILIGWALWLALTGLKKPFTSALSKTLALAASVVGLLSFLEFCYGWDLGIDQLLFTAGVEDLPGSVRRALMSPIAAVDFFLFGVAIAVLDNEARWSCILHNLLTSITALVAIFGILDFVIYPQNTHTHVAPLTALILFVLSFAVLVARPESGFGALLLSTTVGGVLCRRLLPPAILIPIAIAWLRWRGQEIGFYSDWAGLAMVTVTSGVLLAGLTVWTGFVLDRADAKRRKAEESARRMAAIVTSSNDAVISKTLDGIVTSWNPGAESIYGYSAEDMIGQSVNRVVPPDRLNEFEGFLQVLRLGETVRHHETERTRKDGKTIAVALCISPLKDEKGRIVGASTIARDISERKRSEQKLLQASRYTRSLIEASLDPLVTISKLGKITDVNKATENATGHSRDRLIGSDFCDYFTEPERAREGYQQVFERGFVRDYALAIRNVSGTVMDVLYNATVFQGQDGGVEGVFAAARDITQRKRAEEALQTESSFRKSIIENVAEGLCVCQMVDDFPYVQFSVWNERMRQITGYSIDEINRKGWYQAMYPDPQHQERARQRMLRMRDGDDLHGESWEITRRDGKKRLLQITTSVVTANHGAQHVLALMEDVSELKRTEQELRLSRERLALALKAGHSGTFDWDMQNNINRWTPEVEEVHGLAPGKFGGTFEDWEVLVVPEDLPRAKECIERSIQTGEFEGDWRIHRHNDGQIRWITARAKVFNDEKGKPWRMIGLNMDVTERKQAEEEVRKLNDELEQRVMQRTAELEAANKGLEAANKELEAFTYSVSHDLRAPLRHIGGFSKILSEEFSASLSVDAQHHVQRIQEGTRHMGQLVDDLLNLGQVGRKQPSLRVTALRSIVDDVIESLNPDVGDRQVEWKIGDLPQVECDTNLIQQVFQNLLSNALKFTRPRQHAVIEIGQQLRNRVSVVYVRDNGVGFSMKYADKLFGVFQRLHRAEDFEGTGVGLATAQRIIQKHGGRIWVEAELDKGATFYFTLGAGDAERTAPQAACAGKA